MPRKGYIFSKETIDAIAREFNYEELEIHPRDVGRMCSYESRNSDDSLYEFEDLSLSEDSDDTSREDSVKIHVYLKTGTVATCLRHPRSGKTQLFRRNLSLSDIENIFENPRIHTGRGYLQNPHAGHIDSRGIAEKRLSSRSRDALRNCRPDLDEKKVHSISIGVNSFFILYNDGTFNYYNIPVYLKEKLEGCNFEEDPIPVVVSLGSHHEDSYFVQFANGSQSYRNLPENLARIIENSDSKVDVIGFGGQGQGLGEHFFVRFLDGNMVRSLPERLEDKLENKYRDLKISRISFGDYKGGTSYAVKFSNGHQTVNMRGQSFYENYERLSPKYVVVGGEGHYIMMD